MGRANLGRSSKCSSPSRSVQAVTDFVLTLVNSHHTIRVVSAADPGSQELRVPGRTPNIGEPIEAAQGSIPPSEAQLDLEIPRGLGLQSPAGSGILGIDHLSGQPGTMQSSKALCGTTA
jgi:hypothetical protein